MTYDAPLNSSMGETPKPPLSGGHPPNPPNVGCAAFEKGKLGKKTCHTY